jgi:hypothetical protein
MSQSPARKRPFVESARSESEKKPRILEENKNESNNSKSSDADANVDVSTAAESSATSAGPYAGSSALVRPIVNETGCNDAENDESAASHPQNVSIGSAAPAAAAPEANGVGNHRAFFQPASPLDGRVEDEESSDATYYPEDEEDQNSSSGDSLQGFETEQPRENGSADHHSAPGIPRLAAINQAIRDAARTDERTRHLLYVAGSLSPRFIPIEVLEDDTERTQSLCRSEIMTEIRPGAYAVDPDAQFYLRNVLSAHEATIAAESLPSKVFEATCMALTRLKMKAALRLLQQLIILRMVKFGLAPSGSQRMIKAWDMAFLDLFTCFLVIRALQISLIIAESFLLFLVVGIPWMIAPAMREMRTQKNWKTACYYLVHLVFLMILSAFAMYRLARGERVANLLLVFGLGLALVFYKVEGRGGIWSWKGNALAASSIVLLILSSITIERLRRQGW